MRPTVRIVTPAAASAEVGVVVVIDVLRAFTTSAFAFAAGAHEISLVSSAAEAFALRDALGGDVRLMGEDGGIDIPGFDVGNSPCEFIEREASPRWIQRTSAGTRAAVAAANAEHLIVASMVCADAAVDYVRDLNPVHVALVISGARGRFTGDDDRACAEYLAAKLVGDEPEPASFLERIRRSPAAAKFLDPGKPAFPPRDLELALEANRFDFAMVARRVTDAPPRLTVRAVGSPTG